MLFEILFKRKLVLFTIIIILGNIVFGEDNYVAKALADENGVILYGENVRVQHPLASLTKMMTALIVLEKIESGEVKLTDKVKISRLANRKGGSSIHLRRGMKLTVEDLLKGAIIHSGNDAAYSLAEYISGTEVEFVKLMNEKAKKLGLKNTHYYSSTGLPMYRDDKFDMSTIEDVAKLTAYLIKNTNYTDYSSKKTVKISTWKGPFGNTNKLIGKYLGMDGMKTGYHDKAGYNYVATAKRDSKRYITVVFGAPTDFIRRKEAKKLLDDGFLNYDKILLAKEGEFIKETEVKNAKERKVEVVLSENIELTLSKKDIMDIEKIVHINENIQAPLKEGQEIGTLVIKAGEKVVGEYSLVSKQDIKKLSTLGRIIRIATFNKI